MLEMLKKMMAKRCDSCPLCTYARKNPESLIGRVVAFHGKLCPFWRCWQAEYGDKRGESQTL